MSVDLSLSLIHNGITSASADQIRKLNALVDVARILTACRSTAAVINKVLTSAMIAFETADAGIFYLYDEAAGALKLQTSVGLNDEVHQAVVKPGAGMSGRVFAEGQAALYNDYSEIHHVMYGSSYTNGKQPTAEMGTQALPMSALAAPLKLMGQPMGVIVLNNFNRSDAFSHSDLNLLQSLADQAAIAIDNVRLYERQTLLVQQLEQALYETEIRGKRDLIDELLNGKTNADFERSAKALGIEPSVPCVCLWMNLDRFVDYSQTHEALDSGEAAKRIKQQLYQCLSQIVRLQSPGSFVSLKSHEFIVFLRLAGLAGDHESARNQSLHIAEEFQRELAHLFSGLTVSIGIGPVVRGLESLISSLHDVQRMVNLHQQNHQYGRIFFTEDLGVDRLLLQFGNNPSLQEFANEMLGMLLNDGTPGNHDLLDTLAAFFANHRNIADTARATHLHPNTVRYRLDRVKELVKNDDWLGVELAVRIYRLFGHI